MRSTPERAALSHIVQQLSPLDASFLYAETPRAPMHVGALSIYDPASARHGGVSFEALVEHVRRRAGRIDCFHQRLVEVPFQLDHPYWVNGVDAAEFRPERHMHRARLPDPGDWGALCGLVGRLHSRRLDRKRPLWEMHVIEGLERVEGLPAESFGVFVKLHHAAVDGVAGIGVTLALHDLEADPPEPPSTTWEPEAMPSEGELLTLAYRKALLRPARWLGTPPALGRLAMRPLPFVRAPRTRFDRGITGERVVGTSRFAFEGLHRMETAVPGATVNDVVLTVVGGALRRYLEAKAETPAATLVAMAPISVRSHGGEERGGNRLSQMFVPLHSDLADPLERLEAVRAGTARGKERAREVDPDALTRWSELVPASCAARTARFAALSVAPAFNTVVSDVTGPQVPLYCCGAELLQVYGVGPVGDGAGLFHTALSYRGDLTITTTSCASMMPDPDLYHACLRSSHEELLDATRVDTSVSRPLR